MFTKIKHFKLILLTTVTLLIMQTIAEAKTKAHELTEIIKLDPTIKLDIRYATKNNFLGRPVYKEAKAYLQKPVAEALVRVNKDLKKDGYGLLIFDGYRPWSVTKFFWDETEPAKRKFVADPKIGSNHNRGCAVDLSLYDLKTGKEVKMPCEYDTFNECAYPTFIGGTKKERLKRDFLIKVMERYGFTVHSNEWWHYDHKDCGLYDILDIPLEKITSDIQN